MYTNEPKYKFAKAYGRNLRVSAKSSALLCRVIRKKTLKRARRLLNGLVDGTRNLEGKYYTKTAKEMLYMLNSCEKNATSLGLDVEKLFVHASAHKGQHMRRRRRKAAFGSSMKTTNLEIMLIERGKIKDKLTKKEMKEKKEIKIKPKTDIGAKDHSEIKKGINDVKSKQHTTIKKTEELEKNAEKFVGKNIKTHADERKKNA